MTKKFDLGDYLKKDEAEEIVYKPLQYINMPECFQNTIGLPGLPLGYLSMGYGLSDSGKTEIVLHAASESVKQDILPILVFGENKIELARLNEKGLVPNENCIVVENISTLEDFYDYVSMKVEDIKTGRLKMNCMIFLDSIASLPSKDSFEFDKDGRISKKYGPQKNAQTIGYYNPIVAKRVASTREMTCDYSLGLFLVNQAYKQPPEFPGAPTTVVPNGGEKIWFPLGLSFEIKEGKRIKKSVDGRDFEIALITKIKVKKNHITGVYASGEVLLSGNEMMENTEKNIKEVKEKFKNA